MYLIPDSASIGETLIAEKIQESEEAGKSFEEVVAETEKYIKDQQTFFVLETLETLRKNGRLSNLKAWVAGALNIKPVMGATPRVQSVSWDRQEEWQRHWTIWLMKL